MMPMRMLRTPLFALLALAGSTAMRAAEGAAGPDQTLCGTATILGADPLGSGESGSWAVLNGTATFADNNSPVSQVTGLSPGDNVLQWTIVGDGPPEIDQMIITVYDPAATVAFAGPDSVLCLPVDTMHLLAAPAVQPAIGSWSSVGIALIDLVSDPHSPVEFPSGGTVQMIWTVFNGTCGQVSDTSIISVEECVIGVEEGSSLGGAMLAFDPVAFNVRVRNAVRGDVVQVLDQSGRVVVSGPISSPDEQRIEVRDLPPGTYMARILGNDRARTLRFVVAR